MTALIRRRSRRAFTLIEILIVVMIMGLLTAIALPNFMRARDNAYARSCQHNLKEILGAKERWAMDHDKGDTDTPLMDDLVLPYGYLKNTPSCPAGGTYTIGALNQDPTCSIGGVVGDQNAHIIP